MIIKAVQFSLAVLLLSFSLESKAQISLRNLIGVNWSAQVYPDEFRLSPGITFEKQYKKHSGFETGLYYVTKETSGIITISGPSGTTSSAFSVSERHLFIPLMYKFYSKIVNVSAGPSADIYIGWKQKKNQSTITVTDYNVSPNVRFGFLLKAGKKFDLNSQLILEPEIRFGSSDSGSKGFAIGAGLKYKL